jgi:hypothetical protein
MPNDIPFFNARIAPEGGSFDAWKTQSLLDSLEQAWPINLSPRDTLFN